MTVAKTRSARIEVRTTQNVKALLQRAAAVSRKNVTEFLIEAGIDAAEDALAARRDTEASPFATASIDATSDELANRRVFLLDAGQWRAFQEVLDRPVADNPRLARLLAEKSTLE